MYEDDLDILDDNYHEYCYECTANDDNYYIGEDGILECACENCFHNQSNWEDGYLME